jgi:hypothetical protein
MVRLSMNVASSLSTGVRCRQSIAVDELGVPLK